MQTVPQKKISQQMEQTALARFIDRRLKELDLTQADLARRLNVHQSYISHIVNGRRLPDIDAPDFVTSYARALEVDEEVFVTETELWRYNIVPPGPAEVAPADRAVLAAIGHLPTETRHRVARALRELFPVTKLLSDEEEDFVTRAFREAAPDAADGALETFLGLLQRYGAAESSARAARPATPQAPPPPEPPARPIGSDPPGTER